MASWDPLDLPLGRVICLSHQEKVVCSIMWTPVGPKFADPHRAFISAHSCLGFGACTYQIYKQRHP